MRPRLPVLWLALILSMVGAVSGVVAQTYQGKPLVNASLVADTTAIVPGKPFRVGLVLKTAQGWHTYWQYGGDAGIATQIQWKLPAGFEVGPIAWPLPEAHLQAEVDILTYTYSGEVMLMQTIQPPADLAPGTTVELQADASWLVCAEICIPGKAEGLTLTLPVAADAAAANAAEFERWTQRLPSSEPPPFPVSWSRSGEQVTAKLTPPAGATGVDFFPLPTSDEDIVGRPAVSGSAADGFTISVESRNDLHGVLVVKNARGEQGWQLTAKPAAGPAAAAPAPANSTVQPEPKTTADPTLLAALAAGLLGGLILNLMPCVLPVISLKIFGFVSQAGQSRRRIALHGLSFSAGIFAWFLGLGAVVSALKASGTQVTWAFQFQNPWFNLAIATLVFVFALNLFGVFELTLPGRASTKLSEAGSHDGYGGSFFQGVFATLLATPCTGPFLGSSLGFAFSQPAPITMLLFASMATGMALPYLALSAQPAWVRFLPKPGLWMERLKQFMGFPLLGALLWLLFIIGGQQGTAAVIWTAAFLLTLGLALWLYGIAASPVAKPRTRLTGLALAVLIAISGGYFFIGAIFAKSEIEWTPYSKAEVDRLLAAGKPVFIDFTADWCLSCKVNERVAIDREVVRKKFAQLGVVPVKADWTKANPEITEALHRFGRVGVPFYVFYPAGKPDDPITLPEVLTPSIVLDALGK